MRNLLALLAFAVLAFAGIGWWLDWYQITKVESGTGGQSFTIDIDSTKIRSDVKKVEEGIETTKQRLAESRSSADKTTTNVQDTIKDVITDPATVAGTPK